MAGTSACGPCEIKRTEHVTEEDVIVICFDVTTLKNSNDKTKAKFRILENVCGLRNSRGGRLFIHVRNQIADNLYHGWLDELIDEPLNSMIEDGSMFTDVYTKDWGKNKNNNKRHNGFLCITVTGATVVATGDFNTHVQTDHSVISPSPHSICSFIQKGNVFPMKIPDGKGNEMAGRFECRNVQFKSAQRKEDTETKEDPIFTVKEILDKLINKGKLKHYISAFSKQKEGGYFYLGVTESETKCPHVNNITVPGFRIKDNYNRHGQQTSPPPDRYGSLRQQVDVGFYEEFVKKMNEELDEHLSIFHYSGEQMEIIPSKEMYKSRFYDSTNKEYVFLEIAVSGVPGLVFETKRGPISFYFDRSSKEVRKFEAKNWFQLIDDAHAR